MKPSVRPAILLFLPFAAAGIIASAGDVPVSNPVQTAEAIPSATEVATMAARFAPADIRADVSSLPENERRALAKLVDAARLMDSLFLRQVWAGNDAMLHELSHEAVRRSRTTAAAQADPTHARLHYFLINKGPWSRLDHNRVFVAGAPPKPEGGNFYPAGATKAEVQKWIDSLTGDLYVGDAAGIYIPETGDMRPATPPPDFDLDVALESLRTFAALQPARLLFSHFGPVTAVEETLERSAEEIRLWVAETRRARSAGMDLDHAAAMVAERTRERYAVLAADADPDLAAKFDRISGAAANVAGIMHWLDKTGQA